MLETVAEILGEVFRHLFNYLGATIRWTFGNLRRSNGQPVTFREYLYGPNKCQNNIDEDEVSNILIGGILFLSAFIIIIILFLF